MSDAPQCSAFGLTDTDLIGLVRCARHRLVVIAPGLSEAVAKAIVETWYQLGASKVQVVLDPDPEVCRMGFGEMAALQLLHHAAAKVGAQIHQQPGLRIGLVITDETTTIYSPTPLLVEAGGQPGEKTNAIRLETPILSAEAAGANLGDLNLDPKPLKGTDVKNTADDLKANPVMKFDIARKVRVFNAQIEFVDFQMHGLSISRRTVKIPADLMLATEPKAQKLVNSNSKLIGDNADLSGDRVNKLKQFIVKKYLIQLPGYGAVILRMDKADFEVALSALKKYVVRFQRLLKKKLQAEIDANRELLVAALLPSVTAMPPERWNRFRRANAGTDGIERLLRLELSRAFGNAEDLLEEMTIKAVFKGVTYESLTDPDFIKVARKHIPELEFLSTMSLTRRKPKDN